MGYASVSPSFFLCLTTCPFPPNATLTRPGFTQDQLEEELRWHNWCDKPGWVNTTLFRGYLDAQDNRVARADQNCCTGCESRGTYVFGDNCYPLGPYEVCTRLC